MKELKELQEKLISIEREIVMSVGSDLIAPIKWFDTFQKGGKSVVILEFNTSKEYLYSAFLLGRSYCNIAEACLDEKYVFLQNVDILVINQLREELKSWTNIQFGYKVLNPNWEKENYYDFGLHGIKTSEEAEILLVKLVKQKK